jgi:peptidoglycan-associated lipoprotein
MRPRHVLLVGLVLLAVGCAPTVAKQPPAVDVTGRWTGLWIGYGIVDIPREEYAEARLTQQGSRGHGQLTLSGTGAAESVPLPIRHAGEGGSRVVFEVSGSDVVMRHELGAEAFVVDFTVDGDRMDGRVRGADPPVRIVLHREKAAEPVAAVPLPPPPAEALVPPPPAPAPAPEPPAVTAAPPPPPPAPPAPEPPPAARPAPREFVKIEDLRPIYFDFDRAVIRPGDAKILDANAEWLKEHPDMLVMIEGHCDERGTNEYNLALGERRARATRDYLISRGVVAERITLISYGEERPTCTERNEGCWRLNRRAEFLVKPR